MKNESQIDVRKVLEITVNMVGVKRLRAAVWIMLSAAWLCYLLGVSVVFGNRADSEA